MTTWSAARPRRPESRSRLGRDRPRFSSGRPAAAAVPMVHRGVPAQAADRGLHDVIGRGEVGFAGAETDDRARRRPEVPWPCWSPRGWPTVRWHRRDGRHEMDELTREALRTDHGVAVFRMAMMVATSDGIRTRGPPRDPALGDAMRTGTVSDHERPPADIRHPPPPSARRRPLLRRARRRYAPRPSTALDGRRGRRIWEPATARAPGEGRGRPPPRSGL